MCSPRGLLLGILGVGVPLGSPNPDPISDQKKNVIFHTRFQTGPLKFSITRNRRHFAPAKYLARGFKLSRWRHKESST